MNMHADECLSSVGMGQWLLLTLLPDPLVLRLHTTGDVLHQQARLVSAERAAAHAAAEHAAAGSALRTQQESHAQLRAQVDVAGQELRSALELAAEREIQLQEQVWYAARL
jgi:hypothetical protein